MATAAIALMAAGTSEAQTPQKQVTFTKDVAPIFQEKCEACHRPDSIAPMSLRTYEEARPWARSIRARVESRQMPPWHIDKTVGIQQFKNDRSLSDDQIATILAWVDQGAVKGDPKDMPAAREWPDDQGWNYAARFGQTEPDLIIRGQPWTQKAGQGNTWFKRMVDTGVTEPRWVRAIEVRPGSVKGRKITHHANVEIDQVEPDGTRDARPVHGMGGRQGRRADAARHRQADAAGLTHRLGRSLRQHRRRRHRHGGNGRLLLPEGAGAQVSADAPQRRQRRHRARHPAQLDRRARGISSCCRRRRGSRASSRTCTCAARRSRSRRFCRPARR